MDVIALPVLEDITPGTNVAQMIWAGLSTARLSPESGDILVISSKVIAKAQGLFYPESDRAALIQHNSADIVAQRRTPHGLAQIVRTHEGWVLAASGVDASNVSPASDGTARILDLPRHCDDLADQLRQELSERGWSVGILISDTMGRAWRNGQTDVAIGASGILVIDDCRGSTDHHGRTLDVTERAIADELASAAELVKGKATGTPIALIRGSGYYRDENQPATTLVRTPAQDWFRWGWYEAVARSLGYGPHDVPVRSIGPESDEDRRTRAIDLALGPGHWVSHNRTSESWELELRGVTSANRDMTERDMTEHVDPHLRRDHSLIQLGIQIQRLTSACWAEEAPCTVTTIDTDSSAGQLDPTAVRVRLDWLPQVPPAGR